MAKDFFSANNIAFTDYNVGTDLDKRKEMIEKNRQIGVPFIFLHHFLPFLQISADVIVGKGNVIGTKKVLGQVAEVARSC